MKYDSSVINSFEDNEEKHFYTSDLDLINSLSIGVMSKSTLSSMCNMKAL